MADAVIEALLEAVERHVVPFRVLVFASWSLAEALVKMAPYRQNDCISLLQKNQNVRTSKGALVQRAPLPRQQAASA